MRLIGVLFLIFLLSVGAGIAFTFSRWESVPPGIHLDHEFKALGRSPALKVTIDDAGTGLRHVAIHLKQGDHDIALADDSFGRGTDKAKTYDVGKLISDKYKVERGPATLSIEATDFALRNFMRGNQAEFSKSFEFHVDPPKLEVLDGQHYINQGGSECVVYRVSGDVESSGVKVGEHLFPGFPVKGQDPNVRFALFALEYDLPADTPIKVVARDSAGNETTADFWKKVFPKSFRTRDIPIDDAFLQKVVPEIVSHTPSIKDQGDLPKTFVDINSNLRHQNHATIAKLAKQSAPQFFWDGPFLQLSNSKVEASFADRRTYLYKGERIDQQDHVGFDLSVVQQTPIEAANDGVVLLAEYFGIYGNAVLIDHGAGLISLYGHMSSIDVKPGQQVKKKDIIGKSGATGLAAGDHLHFGLFLDGVPVNPTEWWDGKWIKDHVTDRFNP